VIISKPTAAPRICSNRSR